MADTPNPTDLADRLEEISSPNFPGVMGYAAAEHLRTAAAELRRLVADNQRLCNGIKAHLNWTIREQGAEPSDTELALWALIEGTSTPNTDCK